MNIAETGARRDGILLRTPLAWVTTGLALVTAVIIIFSARDAQLAAEDAHAAWLRYSDESVEFFETLSTLENALGYGGLIHNFKNYVLRGDQAYLTQSQGSLKVADTAITRLSSQVTAEPVLLALARVRQTVANYQKNLELVQVERPRLTLAEIDALVRVDDQPAFAALEIIRAHAEAALQQQKRDSLLKMSANDQALSRIYFLAAVVLLAGLISTAFVHRYEKSLDERTYFGQQLNILFNSSPEGLLLIDDKGLITRTNRTAVRMFGYDRLQELEGMSVERLVPSNLSGRHKAHRQAYYKAPSARIMGIARGGIEAQKRNGDRIPVEITLNQVANGASFLTLVTCRDMSAHRKTLEKLEEAAEDAMSLSASKTRFLAVMSHELRTPLNAVIGFSELISNVENLPADKVAEYARDINTSGRHLLDVIDDVLEYSKAEQSQSELHDAVFNSSELVAEVYRALTPIAASKGVALIGDDRSPKARILVGDSVKIKQIMYNLASNALKFTEQGSVTLEYDEEEDEQGLVTGIFSVQDTGIGVPAAAREKIFLSFEQADSSVSRLYGGTGLGLAISRKLAQLMGGDVILDANIREGSRFVFSFVAKLDA